MAAEHPTVMAKAAFYLRSAPLRRRSPRLWATLGGVALGMGIWSMHFVGMVAWHAPFPLYYAIGPTIISILVAIAASVLAFFLVTRKTALKSATANFLGALIVGSGICS